MSHFTVLAKVTQAAALRYGSVEAAIEEMLKPYLEQTKDPQFLTFEDKTQEIMESGVGFITADSYIAEDNPEAVGQTYLQFYGGFERFAEEYHGYKKNPETNVYGYWHNPNAKWDWFCVGGRWRGKLPIKLNENGQLPIGSIVSEQSKYDDEKIILPPNRGDGCFVADLDIAAIDANADVEIAKFWDNYQKYLEIQKKEKKESTDWHLEFDVNDTLFGLGIRRCVKEREKMFNPDGTPFMVEDYDPFHRLDPKKPKKMIQKWTDPVYENSTFTLGDLKTTHHWYFEFSTYAVLDENGWHAKGEMGWWGMSSESNDDASKWRKSYMDTFIRNEKPDVLLVLLDCHI